VLDGMGFQIPAGELVLSLGEDGIFAGPQVAAVRVRMDLWPTWLEIGCTHTNKAREAGLRLGVSLPDSDKATLMSTELQAGLVAIAASPLPSTVSMTRCVASWGRIPTRFPGRSGRGGLCRCRCRAHGHVQGLRRGGGVLR
jgi:hypothetical protein